MNDTKNTPKLNQSLTLTVMKKVLLSLAAVGVTMSANAQLLNYGFETDQILPGQILTENWSDVDSETGVNKFANCQVELSQEKTGINESRSLYAYTDVECQAWQRVVAFTNIGLEENTSYRISLWVKGEGNFNVALLKGCFNHDCALQAGNGTDYVDQTTTLKAENKDDYVRYSYVVWSPSREVMSAKKEDFKNDEYWNQDFLRLSFLGTGTYNVDDVKIEKSTLKGIVYNGDAIRVDFGYATNAADLQKEAGSAIKLDPSCVTVKEDGEPVVVSSVEIKDNGQFYIFLAAPLESGKVQVSFKNPGSLKYTSNVAPNCFEDPKCAVLDFVDEEAYFNGEFFATSVDWEEAALVSSDPKDDSFEYEGTIDTFTFNFDKLVSTNDEENGVPEAFLLDEFENVVEELDVVQNEELSKTIVVKRKVATELADGIYKVSLNNVSNANSVATTTPFIVSFEVGLIKVARETTEPLFDLTVASETAPGAGWLIYNEGQERNAAENSYGSGPRRFDFTNSTVAHAAYFRTKYADNLGDPGVGYVAYGATEGYEIELPKGDSILITPIFAAWKNPGFKLFVEIIDADTKEVYASKETEAITANANGGQNNIDFQKDTLKIYSCKGGKFIFKMSIVDKENQHEALCGGFNVEKFHVDGGDIANPITVLKENFAEWTNNVPAAESGWQIYDNGAALTSNTGASRIMATSPGGGANMSCAYFCRHWTDNLTEPKFYLIYGDNAEHPEKVINITTSELKYDITYFGAIWNANHQGTLVVQILDMDNNVVLENKTELKADFDNSANNSVNPDRIALQWEAAPGQYKLKAFGTSCTLFGNVKIEYPGKRAVKYKNMILDAIEAAEAEVATSEANPDYACATLDELKKAIADAKEAKMHHADEYGAVIDHMNDLVSALIARRKNVNDYASTRDGLAEIIGKCEGTLKVNLDEYKNAVAVYDSYKEVSVLDLDNDALAKALSEMKTATDLLKNQVNTIIPLVTKQITTLADMLVKADEETYAQNDAVIMAGKVLDDDQELAKALKMLNTAILYKKIADGYNFFTVDQVTELEIADSLDVTAWIQNSVFYCNAGAEEPNGDNFVDNFPGWNIVTNLSTLDLSKGGYLKERYTWEGKKTSATNPIVDLAVYAGGNNEDYVSVDVSQQIEYLPGGTFTYYVETCDRTGRNWNDGNPTVDDPDPMKSYVYYFVSEDNKGQQQFAHELVDKDQWYPMDKNYMYNVKVPAAGNYASTLKIGANLMPFQDKNHGAVDNAKLFMTAKDPAFDYGKAYEEVLKDAVNGLQNVEVRTDAPVSVTYYNMAGQQLAAPQGVGLKIERYSDGYVVVKKVLVK